MTDDDPNPLFDRLSEYARYRAGFVPNEKLRGFFLQLNAAAKDPRTAEPSRGAGPADWRAKLAPVVGRDRGHASGTVRLVVSSLDPRLVSEGIECEVLQVGSNGKFSAHLTGPIGWGRGAACRLFLISPVMAAKLKKLTGEELIEEAFASHRVTADRNLARLLSALPDADGRIAADGTLDLSIVNLPDCPFVHALPDDVSVVVAVDGAAS